jgi:hypothetical protein
MRWSKCLYGVNHMIFGFWLKSVKFLYVNFKFILITFHYMSKFDHYWTGACSLFYDLFLSWIALADVWLLEMETPSVLFISVVIYMGVLVFRTAVTLPRAHSHSCKSVLVTAVTLLRAHGHLYERVLVLGTVVTLTRAQSWSVPCAWFVNEQASCFWLHQFSLVLLLALREPFEVYAVPWQFLLCTGCPSLFQQARELVHPSYYACAWGITDFLHRVFVVLYLGYQVLCVSQGMWRLVLLGRASLRLICVSGILN